MPLNLATVKISRLIDTTSGGFSLEDLKSVIITPFFRKLDGGFSFCFLLEGFFIEIFTPGLGYRQCGQKGILNPKKSVLLVPYLSIFDVFELVQLMISGYGKHAEGNSNIKANYSLNQTKKAALFRWLDLH
ncbi:hypothetical protein OQJ46_11895 [Microbulbifer thermotolerans]|uniref:hypothetical protein n=1 Tax=Microbulbifer thermotolerans TaxID=252514 RepID=UPI00224ADD60|nr:hypothetical protein [Microbulbifer thermotolerans]MCX2780611.1 hypothetical protein [Microbulbifer thermotolerans]MCX2783688.1 hypothetical protein [Microbulbifer thermotolerans]MCX2806152.1 hypothetical protein [Microbulbifer thermotolerans]